MNQKVLKQLFNSLTRNSKVLIILASLVILYIYRLFFYRILIEVGFAALLICGIMFLIGSKKLAAKCGGAAAIFLIIATLLEKI